jgi:sugar/nucleoside kinase (ribokinase family)
MEPNLVFAGRLRRDYLLPPSGRPHIDVPGGNVLYAAAGAAVWDKRVGLLARVGEDYPQDWLRAIEKRGWDIRGVHILPQSLDLRFFKAWGDPYTVQNSNPVTHFARLGLTFPKSLLGYQPPNPGEDDRQTVRDSSPRPLDIPSDYLNARAAHICPLDYASSVRLASTFRQAGVTSISLDPLAGFMTTGGFEDVRTLLHGLTTLLVSEDKLRTLFWGKTDDLWQMAEACGAVGTELVVIKRGALGQRLYDAISRKRFEMPAYPARLFDLTGAGDSFCGGFTAGYQHTFDPVRAVLHGSVSASLTVEGCGAFHALEALPGLAQARLESLAGLVRQA